MSSSNPIDLADHDLAALQEARNLLDRARQAAATLALWTPEEAKRVAKEVAAALLPGAEFYAEWAVRESRIGKVVDKITKNQLACTLTPTAWDSVALGGVRRNDALRIVEIGRPAGVVVGLSNSTSPVATIIFKTILCLMTRNALVISPHPVALGCCTAVTRELQAAIEQAGGPAHALQILTRPTVEATSALMRDPRTDVILATGGTPMVRAAYSSGNPAIGVGSGNVPIYVDASADLDTAAPLIVTAKNFDHGSPCSAPSVLMLHASIAPQMQQALAREGAHICSEQEALQIQQYAFPGGKFNGRVVGRPAFEIAQAAGVQVPHHCQALICPIANPQAGHVMLKEKLSPILGCVVVAGVDQAIGVARLMLQHSGSGHTSGIYSASAEQAVVWGAALDYYRVVVNGSTVHDSTGGNTGLPYTFTIGTGYAGKSSVDCNVGPELLVNWKRVAFPLPGGWAGAMASGAAATGVCASSPVATLTPELQATVLRIVQEELEHLR
ncbi:MAG: aldehyde dehydrogenase family protein [Hydrogenophaga sp.]|uniref:aldehyde dehydrogenase family protein n=1 Tax=Hydrogenophaga sp. TaxID=1904254 RepID=UPI002762FEB3|nr:aldehyde dehydrogenase family protein [Hydrogenophaga sp.]MDP1527516.1 aldehyde dehydrogenase family protein [Rhodocyclaceae bacterium]MDZ4186668.1 aldehyde dehydrogenase family protein [Hydrogenophaga sp.]